jgi:hypothetical protein
MSQVIAITRRTIGIKKMVLFFMTSLIHTRANGVPLERCRLRPAALLPFPNSGYRPVALRLTLSEKRQLTIYLTQIGIDYYGLFLNGATWPSNGGHQMGYKLPILFAGLMLNNKGMLSIGELPVNDSSGKAYFQEDGDTFYISQAEVDITHSDAWAPDDRAPAVPYETGDIGTPEWGIRHSSVPTQDNFSIDAKYRPINSGVGAETALAAIILGLRTTWNHEAFFDYEDRWVATTGIFYTKFAKSMWDKYRSGASHTVARPTNLRIICN